MAFLADEIASVVLDEFGKLPPKRRPAVRDNGLHEWVPLSGIVVKGPGLLQCVAFATGMKCLPASKLPEAKGVAIHDWHAEILALRAFNRFLLDECNRLAKDNTAQSRFISCHPTGKPPFLWRPDLTIHMYCSEAPCGDASMELTISAQADSTPWELPITPLPSSSPSPSPSPSPFPSLSSSSPQDPPTPAAHLLLGRSHFSALGIVRRKPSRADAPPTASKSCSDKIALKQCTSLLSSLTSLLVSPDKMYLSSLILPRSQHSETGCARCFGIDDPNGRMSCLSKGKRWGDIDPPSDATAAAAAETTTATSGYKVVPFVVQTTSLEFDYSKRSVAARSGSTKTGASNLAVAWTADGKVEEGLIGGVLQGRKAFTVKGASATSRRSMWALAKEIAHQLGDEVLIDGLSAETYGQVKESELLKVRRKVKDQVRAEALKGWIRNTGDESFGLS